MDIEKRKFIRHPFNYPVETRVLHPEKKENLVHSKSENIGAGGLLFRSNLEILKNTEVEINLKVQGRKFLLDGTVVRCERINEGQFSIAISFNNPDEVLKARMMEQVVRIELFKERIERRYNVKLDFTYVASEWIKRYSAVFAKHYDS